MQHMKLKGLRAEYKLTQVALAEIIGISEQSYISKENGDTDFKLTEIINLLKYFNEERNANITFEDIFLSNS